MQPLIVTAAVIRIDDCVLLTRRPADKPYARMWDFPGGKPDGDVSPREGLRREILEELGLDFAVGAIWKRSPFPTIRILSPTMAAAAATGSPPEMSPTATAIAAFSDHSMILANNLDNLLSPSQRSRLQIFKTLFL